ncbi:MAG: hypothetical protein WAV04_03920 [Candidatus Microsaccharimonas sp.]
MIPRIPAEFRIPTNQTIDDLIAGVDSDIKEEGSVRSFLGIIRFDRQNSQAFYHKVLYPSTYFALTLELRDSDENLRDRQHRLANAVLSGMIFGHIINESTYPGVGRSHFPYDKIWVNNNLLGAYKESFESHDGIKTVEGRRVGYYAMARTAIQDLSDESFANLEKWSEDLIPEAVYRPNFTLGFGTAIYSGWDYYTDRLLAEGRGDEFMVAPAGLPSPNDDPLQA